MFHRYEEIFEIAIGRFLMRLEAGVVPSFDECLLSAAEIVYDKTIRPSTPVPDQPLTHGGTSTSPRSENNEGINMDEPSLNYIEFMILFLGLLIAAIFIFVLLAGIQPP